MAATYNYTAASVATVDADYVRFLIGDTGLNSLWLFSDEEIDAVLAVYTVAVEAAGKLMFILSVDPDRMDDMWDTTWGGFTRLSWMQKMGAYADGWLG